MDLYGIKASAFQSRIHSNKGSNVHNEEKEIHARGYFPISTSFSLDTIDNLRIEENHERVTDTPEVLDTHLTKEDVDSKVLENNWREKMLKLRCKVFSEKPVTPCKTPSIVKDEIIVQNSDWADRSLMTQAQEVQRYRRLLETEDYMRQCIRQWYPHLHLRTYFFPPIHVNRVPYEKLEVAGDVVLVRHATEEEPDGTTTSSICRPRFHPVGACSQTKLRKRNSESDLSKELPAHEMWIRTDPDVLRQVGDSDVRGDTAQDRILAGLRKMAIDYESKEGMMIISQLSIGQFFRKNSSAVIPSLLPKFQGLHQKYHQGDLDVLIIHKKYGLISGEIKSVGASPSQQPHDVFRNSVKKKVRDYIQQLDKAVVVLKLLISDLIDASVKHALMLPNMPSLVLQDIIDHDSQLAKVTDTPEVLDTHLTKEDVDIKDTQNNWRERKFYLPWKPLSVHQVIVVFLLMTPFTQGISSHCDTSRTMNCTQLFMTCSFDTDIIRLAKNLYMNHLQNNSMDLEIIVVCQRSSKGFHCETTPTYEFVSVESNRLTVKIPEVNLEHVGKYWCNVHGLVDIDQKVCQLSVTDTSSEDCFQQVNGPSDKDDRFSPAIIAIIVLGPLLVLVVTSIIFICFISSGSAKYIATCFNFENCKSGIYAPTTIMEEECEKL